MGSGFTTHNLRWFNPRAGADVAPPMASAEFDHWAQEAMKAQDVDSILDFLAKAPAAREAHPRPSTSAPLFVTLGAAYVVRWPRQPERHRGLLVRPVEEVLAVQLSRELRSPSQRCHDCGCPTHAAAARNLPPTPALRPPASALPPGAVGVPLSGRNRGNPSHVPDGRH